MPRAQDPSSSRRLLLVSLGLSLLLAGGLIAFLLLRDRWRPELAGAPDAGDPEVAAARLAPPAGAETTAAPDAVKEATKEAAEEPTALELPPLLTGRVTGEGAGIGGATVLLFATSRIEGFIEKLESFAPEPGELPDVQAIAALIREELAAFRAAAVTTKSKPDGVYEFRGIDPGGYLVLAHADDWLFRYGDVASLERGQTRTLDLPLDAGESIAGRVVDAQGAGLAGVTVIAEPRPAGMAGLGTVVRKLLKYVNGEFLRGPFDTRTAADGGFVLRSLMPGTYDVSAFQLEGLEARATQIETGSADVVIYLGEPAALKGRIVDDRNAAVSGLTVLLERQEDLVQVQIPMGGMEKVANTVNRMLGDGPKKLTTGKKGQFEARPLAPGQYKLSVEAPGFFRFSRDLELDWGEAEDLGAIRVSRGAAIAGHVFAEGGKPLAGARVLAMPAKPNFMNMGGVADDFITGRSVAITGDDGAFRIAGLARGQYRVIATCTGFAPDQKSSVDTGAEPVVLSLQPGRTVTGRVVAAATGEPIADARVKIRESRARTDAEGRFVVDGVSAKSQEINPFGEGMPGQPGGGKPDDTTAKVKASAPGFLEGKVEIDLKQDKLDVTLALEVAPEVRGVVLDPDGKPAPGALVRLSPAIPDDIPAQFDFIDTGMIFFAVGVADLEGRFRFKDLRNMEDDSRYRIIADHVSYARGSSPPFGVDRLLGPKEKLTGAQEKAAPAPAPGDPAADPTAITVQLVKGSRIRGVVTDGSQPVPGASVRLMKSRKGKGAEAEQMSLIFNMFGLPKGGEVERAGKDGRFEIVKVLPGEYQIAAEKLGYVDSEAQGVTVQAGDDHDLTLVIQAGGAIAGTVVTAAGEALPGAKIRLLREPGDDEGAKRMYETQKFLGGAVRTTRSGEDGSFALPGLAPGSYALVADHAGFVKAELGNLTPGGDAVRVALQPAAAFAGVVVDAANGAPVTRFQARFRKDGTAGVDLFDQGGLDGREYSDPDGRFKREDLEPGSYEVKVKAAGYASLRLNVVVAAGAAAEQRFALAQAGRVRGAVTDLMTGAPIAGARVYLVKDPAVAADDEPEAGGSEEVRERARARREAREARREERGEEIVAVAPTTDEDQTAVGEHFQNEMMNQDAAVTRDDGTFLLEGVKEEPRRLVVSHAEYISASKADVTAPPATEIEVSFALKPGVHVSGRVLDAGGRGAAGRLVFARGTAQDNVAIRKSSTSGPDGSFRIGGLATGTYRLFVVGGGPTEKNEAMEIDLADDRSGVELRLGGAASKDE